MCQAYTPETWILATLFAKVHYPTVPSALVHPASNLIFANLTSNPLLTHTASVALLEPSTVTELLPDPNVWLVRSCHTLSIATDKLVAQKRISGDSDLGG